MYLFIYLFTFSDKKDLQQRRSCTFDWIETVPWTTYDNVEVSVILTELQDLEWTYLVLSKLSISRVKNFSHGTNNK